MKKQLKHDGINCLRDNEIRRITGFGMVVNALLAFLKISAGIASGSQAVVADGVHSISDMATDLAIVMGVHYWSEPADEKHPYGHGRLETVISLGLGLVLILVAVGLGAGAVLAIREKHEAAPGLMALLAAAFSIVCKEWLYRKTIAAGRRLHSQAMVANAWHHRSDAMSSVCAVIGVGGVMIFPAWGFLDHLGAIVVCLLIMQVGLSICWTALQQLMDRGLPKQRTAELLKLATTVSGVHQVHALRSRHIGNGWSADLHVEVDSELTVAEGHEIAASVKYLIRREVPDIIDIIVHIEPFNNKNGKDKPNDN